MSYTNLLQPYGPLSLTNSIVMAPMTTCHADTNQVPTDEMVRIYRDRASVGLLIAEATCISDSANAYPRTPGIYTDEQQLAWEKITHAVHKEGGKIFLQIWHAGPMGHRAYRNGKLPLSPSGIKPLKDIVPRSNNTLRYEHPKEMDEADIKEVKNDFVQAALRAKAAGFDGVELHGASGYLLDSFLHCSTNKRQDSYGGTPKNMCRFILEVIREVKAAVGDMHVAFRACPVPLPSMGNMSGDPRDKEVFAYLLKKFTKMPIAYVNACSDNDAKDTGTLGMRVSEFVRTHYSGTVIAGGSYSIDEAEMALKEKRFSLIYWGRMLLANPDLVTRLEDGNIKGLTPFSGEITKNPPRLGK
jgi:2,4-dienoyl-CoA reductase-like NADH-dependent reductase (Old Yellow Enzyme family)